MDVDVNELPLLDDTEELLRRSTELRLSRLRCAKGAADTSSSRKPPRVARWNASKVARSADSAARGEEEELSMSGVISEADQWLLFVCTQEWDRNWDMVSRR